MFIDLGKKFELEPAMTGYWTNVHVHSCGIHFVGAPEPEPSVSVSNSVKVVLQIIAQRSEKLKTKPAMGSHFSITLPLACEHAL